MTQRLLAGAFAAEELVFTLRIIPLFLSVVIALILCLLGWGYWQLRARRSPSAILAVTDQVLTGLGLLAGFVLGAFLAYALLTWLVP